MKQVHALKSIGTASRLLRAIFWFRPAICSNALCSATNDNVIVPFVRKRSLSVSRMVWAVILLAFSTVAASSAPIDIGTAQATAGQPFDESYQCTNDSSNCDHVSGQSPEGLYTNSYISENKTFLRIAGTPW